MCFGVFNKIDSENVWSIMLLKYYVIIITRQSARGPQIIGWTLNLDKLRVIGIVSNIVSNVARQIKRVLDLRINLAYLSVNIYIHSCTTHLLLSDKHYLLLRSRVGIHYERVNWICNTGLYQHCICRFTLESVFPDISIARLRHYFKNGERFILILCRLNEIWN